MAGTDVGNITRKWTTIIHVMLIIISIILLTTASIGVDYHDRFVNSENCTDKPDINPNEGRYSFMIFSIVIASLYLAGILIYMIYANRKKIGEFFKKFKKSTKTE